MYRRLALAVACLSGLVALIQVSSGSEDQPIPTKPCATEDSPGPCFWDAESRGNGVGRSFYVDRYNRVHFVK